MEYTKEQLEQEIARTRLRLKGLESIYEAEFGTVQLSPLEPQKALPYAGIRPIKAITAYLKERGETQVDKLVRDMIDGGCSYGANNKEWAVMRALTTNTKL